MAKKKKKKNGITTRQASISARLVIGLLCGEEILDERTTYVIL
jgi:hypothetical protein